MSIGSESGMAGSLAIGKAVATRETRTGTITGTRRHVMSAGRDNDSLLDTIPTTETRNPSPKRCPGAIAPSPERVLRFSSDGRSCAPNFATIHKTPRPTRCSFAHSASSNSCRFTVSAESSLSFDASSDRTSQ